MIHVKILSIQYPERYALRRLVTIAQLELAEIVPDQQFEITEIGDPSIICKYATVIILPTLVINEKVVSSGKHVTKEEILTWLQEASA